MLLNVATKIFGSSNERELKRYRKQIEPINAFEPELEALSDEQLQAKTEEFRSRLEKGETLENIKHEAFAVVREASKRSLGMRHFDVQMIGGLVLNDGNIAEMKTGEGKTLMSTLPVYLNAVSGDGVHVVTVNDYLASRDAEWMGQVYEFLGLSVACITNDMNDIERQDAYKADITYCTNNELGFDYLRDNMKVDLKQVAQRPFNYAIIDEVDSILIDEARTPLIISGPSESATELYVAVDKVIPSLKDDDFDMDEKHKTIVLTEDGTEHVEVLLKEHGLLEEGGMYDIQNISLVHHVNQALRAHKMFHKDTDYIIKDDKVVLIDEFTGRMMDGRRLSEGLHQAIEAKENVKIQTENQTLASITFQNLFRLYPKLAGMTGTAMTEAGEFAEIYDLGVVAIPTNVPIARADHEDKIYRSLREKDDAIVELVKECNERGQPVLVGTVSIEKSESLAARLKKEKIKHNVLNARHHEQEAEIISQAGRPGAVTIATNMAGRGTDIQLGGNPDMLSDGAEKIDFEADKKKVIEAGGLFVLATERHESRRIDNQLRGRSGRQGDPGASLFFLSTEDDLMRVFGGDRLDALLNNPKMGLKEGEALENPLISKLLERAQAKVEGMHFEVRKNLLKYDDVMNDQRKIIYEQRWEIMESEDSDVEEIVRDMRHEVVEDIVAAHIPAGSYSEQWDTESLQNDVVRVLGLQLPVEEWAKSEGIADSEILEKLMDISDKHMAEKAANTGPDLWRRIEKSILLQILDQHWKEHLLNLDHLRQGINLRAFGQKDPLNEYKTEAFGLFEGMLDQMRDTITMTLSLVEVNFGEERTSLIMPGYGSDDQEMTESREDPAMADQPSSSADAAPLTGQPAQSQKVPRNAPCPCGSGKKFKQCHGSLAKQA